MFHGVIWMPLCEYDILNLSNVTLVVWLIYLYFIYVVMSTSDMDDTSITFLLHLGIVTHVDAIDIESSFVNNFLTTAIM